MHAFTVPWWLYAAFIMSLVVLLAGLASAAVVVRRKRRAKANAWGWFVTVALMVFGLLGCFFTGIPLWIFGGLS
jgi:hypothetical protein